MIATVKVHVTQLSDGRWVIYGRVFQTPECAKRYIARVVTHPEIVVQPADAHTEARWLERSS